MDYKAYQPKKRIGSFFLPLSYLCNNYRYSFWTFTDFIFSTELHSDSTLYDKKLTYKKKSLSLYLRTKVLQNTRHDIHFFHGQTSKIIPEKLSASSPF